MSICYIGVGSNVGDRSGNIQKAILYLKESGVDVRRSSGVYESSAVGGPQGQKDYLNLVLEIDTALKPRELLVLLKNIEKRVGRQERLVRWDNREIDLDIICCEDVIVEEGDLVVPHPQMHKRFFVLKPLSELAPHWHHPVIKKDVTELLSEVKNMPEVKKLCRIKSSKKIAGVCAGLAEYFNIDTTWVRIVFLLALVFGGFGLVIYLICWVAMPVKESGAKA